MEVNPKDLNKNKGLKTSPLFLFSLMYPELSDMIMFLHWMSVRGQVRSFHGRERTSSLSKQGSQKVRDFLGRGRTPATPTSQASSLLQGRSDESKTVLDLLHSLGVEDDMIMFDNFGG